MALGRIAAQALLGTDSPIGRMRGQWFQVQGVPTMVTYHPSYLLRSDDGDLSTRRMVWEDMMLVMEKLGMPIAEK